MTLALLTMSHGEINRAEWMLRIHERRATQAQVAEHLRVSELNIDVLCASSPQAKGRVERAHQTMQDRLVKEMRLRGIDSMAAGNVFLLEFAADYDARFARSRN